MRTLAFCTIYRCIETKWGHSHYMIYTDIKTLNEDSLSSNLAAGIMTKVHSD